MQGPNQTCFLTLRGFLLWAPTLQGPILITFLILRGKSNFINVFNKRYQRNVKKHRNNFLPNLVIAPAGGYNTAMPYPNPLDNSAGQT